MTDRAGAGGLIEIGQAIRVHGLRGQLVVSGVRLSLAEFLALGEVLVAGQRRRITGAKEFQHHLLVRFEGIDDRTAAEALHGAVLEIERERLPDAGEGEVYIFQLLDLPVRTEAGELLGRVADVLQTGATPVLVVKGGGRERLLPMTPEVLVRVDTAGDGITVRLLPGLDEI
jgi:16S rRNA processing protein RimM